MTHKSTLGRALAGALAFFACATSAWAQLDYSVYGVADFSYGRFEPSGQVRQDRFNSNSMSASFVGVNVSDAFDGGWTPGATVETFVRFQDFQTGRTQNDPALSRNAFASLASNFGTLRIGRLQTLLFDATTRFNALGNSPVFSPAVRHVFLSGNLESVQGDFYWNRALSYVSPNVYGVTTSLMYARGPNDKTGDLSGATVVFSRGLFAASLSAQHVNINDGINLPTNESTGQVGASYNFGFARVFGQFTQTKNTVLDVRSQTSSAGVAVPVGPSTVQVQGAYTTAVGLAVNRRHSSLGAAYLYPYDSVTDFYVACMDDRIRGQTQGVSVATGVRWRF